MYDVIVAILLTLICSVGIIGSFVYIKIIKKTEWQDIAIKGAEAGIKLANALASKLDKDQRTLPSEETLTQ